MAISSHQIAERTHLVTISGVLTWSEFQTFLSEAEARNVFANGKVKVLIRLTDFTGWEPGEQWGDVGFFFRHSADIERIAIVSESRWQDAMITFTFGDYQQAEVQMFLDNGMEQAYAWLLH